MMRSSAGEQRPPQLGYLLWALAAVLLGGLLLLGPPLWRRRLAGSPVREEQSARIP
jgi:hypothetical protein